MSSSISSFKPYRNCFRFLFFLIAGIAIFSLADVVIYRIRQAGEAAFPSESLENDFFGRKCLPRKSPVIVYGDSRVYRGIDPETLSRQLQRPSVNLGFSSGGINDEMMRFLQERIDFSAPSPMVILGLSPYSLTEVARANACYRWYAGKLRTSGDGMFLNMNGLRWQDVILMPIPDALSVGSFRAGKRLTKKNRSILYHDNGWAETVFTGDMAASRADGLQIYRKNNFRGNSISSASIQEMLTWIRKWSQQGVAVVVFRFPSSKEMEKLEDELTGFANLQLAEKVRAAGGRWLDLPPDAAWISYDASHLEAASAVDFSRFLGDALRHFSR